MPQYNGEDTRSPVPYHLVNDMKTANSISPTNSNRNSAASSDSGRGYSTGHTEPRVGIYNNNRHDSGRGYSTGHTEPRVGIYNINRHHFTKRAVYS